MMRQSSSMTPLRLPVPAPPSKQAPSAASSPVAHRHRPFPSPPARRSRPGPPGSDSRLPAADATRIATASLQTATSTAPPARTRPAHQSVPSSAIAPRATHATAGPVRARWPPSSVAHRPRAAPAPGNPPPAMPTASRADGRRAARSRRPRTDRAGSTAPPMNRASDPRRSHRADGSRTAGARWRRSLPAAAANQRWESRRRAWAGADRRRDRAADRAIRRRCDLARPC